MHRLIYIFCCYSHLSYSSYPFISSELRKDISMITKFLGLRTIFAVLMCAESNLYLLFLSSPSLLKLSLYLFWTEKANSFWTEFLHFPLMMQYFSWSKNALIWVQTVELLRSSLAKKKLSSAQLDVLRYISSKFQLNLLNGWGVVAIINFEFDWWSHLGAVTHKLSR